MVETSVREGFRKKNYRIRNRGVGKIGNFIFTNCKGRFLTISNEIDYFTLYRTG